MKRREDVGRSNVIILNLLSVLHRTLERNRGPSTPPTLLTVEISGQFTHLIELNPLLVFLGTGVGDPQGSKLGPEQVGGILF